jgi:class 3 adenylate cyclase/tetratricopeptide (TPR) repeat protein
MSEYVEGFEQNGITIAALPHLTDDDLKEIGVLLGHRRVMLAAIKATGNAARVVAEPASLPERRPHDTAERRHVTVMFSDLVGSTALSTRLDPEDVRDLIFAYQQCVTEAVGRYGGFLAKYMGDGVLIYFGYPQAHEDDAERAVRAGLELIAAVQELPAQVPLQTRVGIATGLVVVGDLIGSGEAQERGIVGETPNLAARLQSLAEPNMLVIADNTRKLIGNLFELEDLGPKELKGISKPVRAWSALRPSAVASRFEALHATGMTTLVGRDEENALLLSCWSRARAGEGQVVLLSGEAGIGKSRLTAALLESLAAEPHTQLRYFCSSQHTDSAFYPIIGQMERAAGLQRDDSSLAKLDKLDALLVQTATSKEDMALFAEMLSLPNDGRYPTLNLTPQQRRQRTLTALTTQLERLASRRPVLMIFEDVHWIDPTSLEALKRSVEQIKTFSALLIVTFRPEFVAPWVVQSEVSSMVLNRLGERDSTAIVASLAGKKAMSADVLADIVERTDGVPLFLEEMTKAVLEAASESDARNTTAAVPSSSAPVPASLHASLMARLDRLGPAKEIAQIGAVIGREFPYSLLAAVANEPETKLVSTLGRLTAAGLLVQQGVPPHDTYLFKHALIQDAAYGTLLRGPRRALHARIADTLESQFADIAETQPELVARHCTEAGLIEKAAGLWGKAGQRSLERTALVEAAELFTRALAQIRTLPATPALRREAIKLQVAFASALFHLKGYTASETIAAFECADSMIQEAEALGEPADDDLLRFSVLYGQWTGNYTAGNATKANEVAKRCFSAAERQPKSAPLLLAHRITGATLTMLGELLPARMHLDRAVALYVREEHSSLATRFGQDIGVAALCNRSWVLYRLGYPMKALGDADEALKTAQELGLAGTLFYATYCAGILELLCGRFDIAERRVEEMFALSEKHALAFWSALTELSRGYLFSATNRSDQAVRMINSGMAAMKMYRATYLTPFNLMWLARAQSASGRVNEAQKTVSEALAVVSVTNARWDEAEIHRTAGEIAHDDPELAELHFRRGLDVARQQGAKSYELRAATSLARLWRSQGRRDEARELLAPVFSWFTEGFDMSDLREAKALLET